MLTLHGGPADGAYACKNAPLYLRAVTTARGATKDVLDLPTDEPQPLERVSADGAVVRAVGGGRGAAPLGGCCTRDRSTR